MNETPFLIFLTGFMGAGKSTVGKELAALLRIEFIDLDREIEQAEGTTVPEIFRSRGEAIFRELEAKHLHSVCERGEAGAVIALGGGTFASEKNRARIRETGGLVILLDADIETLRQRVQRHGGTRPLANDAEQFEQLYGDRRNVYALADWQIDTTGKVPAQCAKEIVRILREIDSPHNFESDGNNGKH